MLTMKVSFLFLTVSFLSVAIADPLLNTIKDIEELNTLNSIITASKSLTELLNSARDFTFLAPSNAALDAWFAKDTSNTVHLLETTLLRYHLLHGRFTTETFSKEPQFPHSFLNSNTSSNVTSGQVVEIVKHDGQPVFSSGNKIISSIAIPHDRICSSGYLQIIDRVLELPLNLVDSLSQFGLNYFIAVLNAGGIVDQDKSPFIRQLLQASDITYFAPNTQDAVKAMTEASRGVSETQRAAIARYHLVSGLFFSSELKDGMRLKTLQGAELLVTVLNGSTYVNSARLMTTDYLISNGVLHTIDNLLDSTKPDPPQKSQTPSLTDAPTESHKSTGLSPATQAGIVLGFLAVILLIAALLFLLSRQRKLKTDRTREVDSRNYNQREVAELAIGHQRPNNRARNPSRNHDDDIELEGHSFRNSLSGSQKNWEFAVNAVELDGMGSR